MRSPSIVYSVYLQQQIFAHFPVASSFLFSWPAMCMRVLVLQHFGGCMISWPFLFMFISVDGILFLCSREQLSLEFFGAEPAFVL